MNRPNGRATPRTFGRFALGCTNAEIGDQLHISLSTVKTHLGSLMIKLGARNRVELAIWAYETGRVRS